MARDAIGKPETQALPSSPSATVDRTPRLRGLYSWLHLLILVTIAPLLIIGAIATAMTADDYRRNSEQRLLETATALAGGVDQGIEDNINQLRLLSMVAPQAQETSDMLQPWAQQNPDIRLIHEEAAEAALLPSNLLRDARSTGKVQISDLFAGDAGNTPEVAIALPFVGSDRLGHVVAMVLPSNRLISTVLHSRSDESLLVAVVDSNGVIAARSRSPERYIGRPVPDWNKLKDVRANKGVFSAMSKEGEGVVFAFRMLQQAPGWALVVGEPERSFQARWQRPLIGIIIGGVLALAIALFSANIIARGILLPIRALAQRGRSIVANAAQPPELPASNIVEVHSLQHSFNETVDALKRSADEARALAHSLKSSEMRHRAVAEAGALVLWEADSEGQLSSLTGWQELTGQDEQEALGRGWLRRVNTEDMPQIRIALEQGHDTAIPLDVEFRVMDLRGRWRWLRARGARIGQAPTATWAGVLEDVDARRQAQARIAYLAQHDSLTGLPNRTVLFEQLEHALTSAQRGRHGVLLLLDLDRFKEVNDTLGHPSGDRLLQDVSCRVLGCVRESDLVARLGGDEFAVLMAPEARPPEVAAALATRLVEVLSQPFELDGHQFIISTSIGIVVIDGVGQTAETLMRRADLALYRAKEDGRGCYRFFEAEMDIRMRQRRQLESELRVGLERQQFVLHYQPLVDLEHGRVIGFEALLRWNHPERGLLDPGKFLNLAEDIGLMVPLGDWVLRQAARDAITWPEDLTVAVNLSVSQLAQADLAGNVERALADIGLPAARLELEITENALIANIQAASPQLLELKTAGVAIVMDDFGTGYSSLGYLRAFPFDKVKIDKSFIRDLGEQSEGSAIIGAVSHLCSKLGITTTIEGVETRSQLAQLKHEHCAEGQGYVFSRPMPADKIEAFMREWPLRWQRETTGLSAKARS